MAGARRRLRDPSGAYRLMARAATISYHAASLGGIPLALIYVEEASMLGKGLLALLASSVLTASVAAQTADELIARSVEARGGLEKLKAVSTLRLSGKMTMGAREAALVVELKRPANIRSEANFEGAPAVQAYDGKNAWGIPPGSSKPEPMPAEMTKEMAERADQIDGPLVDYPAKGSQVVLVGRE